MVDSQGELRVCCHFKVIQQMAALINPCSLFDHIWGYINITHKVSALSLMLLEGSEQQLQEWIIIIIKSLLATHNR